MTSKTTSTLKNISVMTLSVGITQIIALLLKTLMPRMLGVEKMGMFIYAESTAALFFAFLPLGLTAYINRHLPAKPDHLKDILWTVLIVQGITAVVISSALFAYLTWEGVDRTTLLATLLMGGYAALFTFQKDIFQKIYVILGEVVLVSRLSVAIKILLVIGSVTILFTAPSVAAIAAMHLFSELVGFLFLLRNAFKANLVQVSLATPYLRTMLKFSLPFYLAAVLNGIYAQIDIFMLSKLSTQIEIGYFGAAYKIIGMGLFLVPVFQNAVTPVLSQALSRSTDSFTLLVKEYLHNLMICALPLAIGLILFGDTVAGFINGPEFDVSKRTLSFLTPVLLMMYLNTFLGGCLYLASSGQKLSLIFLIGGFINIGLDVILIPWGIETFGVGGAGVAVSFATFLCETYVFFAMLLLLPQRIISGRLLWNGLVIFLPCWLGMAFHQAVVDVPFWVRVLIFPLTFPYARLTGLLTAADLQKLGLLLKRRGR